MLPLNTKAVLGITQFDDTVPCVHEELKSLLQVIEYRINDLNELSRCDGGNMGCIVHAPDPECADFIAIVDAVSRLPFVSAVNAHARPDDAEWLCCGCYRRRSVADIDDSPCRFCGEQNPDAWRATFPLERAARTLRRAEALLSARGKCLFIENTYESPDLMAQVLAEVPNAGFTLDTGHSLLYGGGPRSYLQRVHHRLRHLHLHDNHGGDSERDHDLHLPPGEGIVNWKELAQELIKLRYTGTMIFECVPDVTWVHSWLSMLESGNKDEKCIADTVP